MYDNKTAFLEDEGDVERKGPDVETSKRAKFKDCGLGAWDKGSLCVFRLRVGGKT